MRRPTITGIGSNGLVWTHDAPFGSVIELLVAGPERPTVARITGESHTPYWLSEDGKKLEEHDVGR